MDLYDRAQSRDDAVAPHRSRPRHISIEDAREEIFARAPSQEDGLRYSELLEALDRLPEEQKSVLLLATVEGLSYAETAGVLDIPLGTVMSRLSRARERLLKEMEGPKIAAPVAHLRRLKMTSRPVNEDDLHAYVDRVLAPDRETEVTLYLDTHPEVAKRIAPMRSSAPCCAVHWRQSPKNPCRPSLISHA